jgi:hypothetical protein
VDRYIPMGTKNPYGSFSAIPLEFKEKRWSNFI